METKITITEVHVTKHAELKVETEGSFKMNDMLSLEYNGKTYYFRPIEMFFTDRGTTAILKERGYWGDRLYNLYNVSGIDYRCLIGLSLSIMTDKDIIKRIDKESTYC